MSFEDPVKAARERVDKQKLARKYQYALRKLFDTVELAGQPRRGIWSDTLSFLVARPQPHASDVVRFAGDPAGPIAGHPFGLPISRDLNRATFRFMEAEQGILYIDLWRATPENLGLVYARATGPVLFRGACVREQRYGGLLPNEYTYCDGKLWEPSGKGALTREEIAAEPSESRGISWMMIDGEHVLPVNVRFEADFFRLLNIEWVAPEHRNESWMASLGLKPLRKRRPRDRRGAPSSRSE